MSIYYVYILRIYYLYIYIMFKVYFICLYITFIYYIYLYYDIIGYYRLASAQIELQQFDDAETTVVSALTIEPGNEVSDDFLLSLSSPSS